MRLIMTSVEGSPSKHQCVQASRRSHEHSLLILSCHSDESSPPFLPGPPALKFCSHFQNRNQQQEGSNRITSNKIYHYEIKLCCINLIIFDASKPEGRRILLLKSFSWKGKAPPRNWNEAWITSFFKTLYSSLPSTKFCYEKIGKYEFSRSGRFQWRSPFKRHKRYCLPLFRKINLLCLTIIARRIKKKDDSSK